MNQNMKLMKELGKSYNRINKMIKAIQFLPIESEDKN